MIAWMENNRAEMLGLRPSDSDRQSGSDRKPRVLVPASLKTQVKLALETASRIRKELPKLV